MNLVLFLLQSEAPHYKTTTERLCQVVVSQNALNSQPSAPVPTNGACWYITK